MSLDSLPPALPGPANLLEVWQVARRLRVSPDYVRGLIRDQKLAVVQMGKQYRIDEIDLKAFIDQNRQPASPTGIERRRAQRGAV